MDYNDFINQLETVGNLNIELIKKVALHNIKFLRSKKETRKELKEEQILQKQWYDNLKKGKIDYSVYNTDYYIGELWACWIVYSSQYLKRIFQPHSLSNRSIKDDLGDIKIIVDLGCGFGLTTAKLKEMFPKAGVIGTNIKNTKQYIIAEGLGKKYGFSMVSKVGEIDWADLIFASEYFEHIKEPIEELRDVLMLNPKALLISNSFNTEAIGHFTSYLVDGKEIDQKNISRLFNKELKLYGYKKIKTNLWNNRPNYWKK